MKDAKYRLIRAGKMKIHSTDVEAKFYRIQALRDIPKYGVKSGDLGGYVTRKDILSHDGTCWIADEAQAIGKVSVSDSAYVGGKAVVWVYSEFMESHSSAPVYLKGGFRIEENASIESRYGKTKRDFISGIFEGNAKIYGNAKLMNVHRIYNNPKIYGDAFLDGAEVIAGSAKIYGKAYIGDGVTVKDDVEIYGQAFLNDKCTILGSSKIFDNAKIDEYAKIVDSVIAGDTHIIKSQTVKDGKLNEMTIGSAVNTLDVIEASPPKPWFTLPPPPSWDQMAPQQKPQTPKGKVYLRILKDVQEKIEAYETDIVKIIKYPVMTDRTDPFTQEMVVALNNAQRWSEDPDGDDFKDAVGTLEKAYLAAESNALKLASTMLSAEDKKKAQRAKDLLSIASNEASSEQEKKASFQQAFKQLEGVIAVPEAAVDTFRVKIGLAEIEA